jgi:hypothetical protein
MVIRSSAAALGAVLVAVAMSGAAVPSYAQTRSAANNQNPSYDTCYSLALDRGAGRDKGGGTREAAQHKSFMEQCQAGKIPLGTAASAAAATVPPNAYASTAAPRRANRRSAQ